MIFLFSLEKSLHVTNVYTGYNLNVMRQSACLVFNPIMVDNYTSFFYCTPVGRATDFMMPPTKLFALVGWGRSFFSCTPDKSDVLPHVLG